MVSQELKKTLWATADKLRSNMDAASYTAPVFGLKRMHYRIVFLYLGNLCSLCRRVYEVTPGQDAADNQPDDNQHYAHFYEREAGFMNQ